jgi:hypothetical protein
MIKTEINRKPRKHDLTPKEAGSRKNLPVLDRKKLTDDEIITEYKKLPFLGRIVRMGASIHRVRSVVRSAGLA